MDLVSKRKLISSKTWASEKVLLFLILLVFYVSLGKLTTRIIRKVRSLHPHMLSVVLILVHVHHPGSTMVTVSLKTENRSSGMEAKRALRLAFGQPSGSRRCSHPQALSGGCDALYEGEPYSLPLSLESHLESWTSILFCTQTSWKHLLYCFSILM